MITMQKPDNDKIVLLSVGDLRNAGIAPSTAAISRMKRTSGFPAGIRVGKKKMYNALDIYEWLCKQIKRK